MSNLHTGLKIGQYYLDQKIAVQREV